MKMTFTKVRPYGPVTLERCNENGRYYLRFKVASDEGKWPYKRKSLGHKNLAKAQKSAADMAAAMAENPEIAELAKAKHTVKQAMADAIAHSRSRSGQHRSNLEDFARYFQDWMADAYPSIRFWHQISPVILTKYVEHLRDRDEPLSPKTARNYASVVTMTSRHMNRMYPKCRYTVMELAHPALHLEPVEKQYLSREELRFAIEHAAAIGETYAELALLLAGVCGMRLHEVIGLRVHNFDFGRKTVDIAQSKNRQSIRTIPIPDFVCARVWEHFKQPDAGEWLMVRRDSKTGQIEPAAEYTVAKCIRRLLVKCHKVTKNENFTKTAPKNAGRKTWMNLAERAGVSPWRRDAYAGHGGTTMAYKHYVDRNSSIVVEELRRDVLVPLLAYWNAKPEESAVAAEA